MWIFSMKLRIKYQWKIFMPNEKKQSLHIKRNYGVERFFLWKVSSVHFILVAQSCPTLCDPVDGSTQASLSITNSWSLPKLMSIESVMPFNHLILCRPLLLRLQSFPASGSFPMSPFFSSDGQRLGGLASASVLPMNIQG